MLLRKRKSKEKEMLNRQRPPLWLRKKRMESKMRKKEVLTMRKKKIQLRKRRRSEVSI